MADKDHLILTAIGPDQVGLVQKISEFISRHGCNIEDSKMAVFCGEFAIILLISGDSGTLLNVTRDPGAGDFFFVLVWALGTLLLVAYYCYRMFQR